MKQLIIKIIKGIVFGIFIMGTISQIFYGTIITVLVSLIFLFMVWYVIYKYKCIEKSFLGKQSANS